ncbi:hypothetical protein KIK06_15815 [Nocardiopsis sp. EMB25]|uniref:hypothetical protein n=1 Tax=Nocardiopsis sp. EMB25 TaxID=2835867 RepID=UPI002283D1B4|nr:hypothetical protein [Nocardiopsis sp. EMB25]MCY9785351.1 hypothetical protein [Nocardiopsis sp. EMB25]
MKHLLRRSLRLGALLTVLTTAVLATVTAPASAHTSLTSIAFAESGCAWTKGSATILDSARILGAGHTQIGTVNLLWNSAEGENCVVTLKSGRTHGYASYTVAELAIEGDHYHPVEIGNYQHYAAVAAPAAGKCVQFTGIIEDTDGQRYAGGLGSWAFCG